MGRPRGEGWREPVLETSICSPGAVRVRGSVGWRQGQTPGCWEPTLDGDMDVWAGLSNPGRSVGGRQYYYLRLTPEKIEARQRLWLARGHGPPCPAASVPL